MTPVLQVMPVLPENEESLFELQYYLKKSMAQFGRRRISHLIRRPFLLYLPRAKRIAYVVAFHLGQGRMSPVTYFLCYVAEERDWFAFYQLRSLFAKRVRVVVPELANYLQTLENNPLADDIRQNRDHIREFLNDWADLNQYIDVMHALLSEEFFKAGRFSENIGDQLAHSGFIDLLSQLEPDFDRVISAAISLQQVLFVSVDRQKVEQAISALLSYYPHPSVTLWTEKPSDSLFVGTSPNLAEFYSKDCVVVDLDSNSVSGGRSNEFCANLLQETLEFASEMTVAESRMFFQGKISAIFSLVKAFLEVLSLDEAQQQVTLHKVYHRYPEDSIELVYQIARNVNKLLAKAIRQARGAFNIEHPVLKLQ
ncbi:MAG TPA: hypothetical protein VKK79_18315, partial [Candidatus Lokiarchaeia archaeon]|nr:hypothetical protein [Candidatus Lokiarchaeia archaeon]